MELPDKKDLSRKNIDIVESKKGIWDISQKAALKIMERPKISKQVVQAASISLNKRMQSVDGEAPKVFCDGCLFGAAIVIKLISSGETNLQIIKVDMPDKESPSGD